MARLHTSGFESRISSTTGNYGGEADVGVSGALDNGTVTFNTSVQRSGNACLEADHGAGNNMEFSFTGALDRAYFIRAYARFSDVTPSAANACIIVRANALSVGQIRLETNGTLTLRDANLTQVGSATAAISPDTWYRLELKIIIPTSSNGTLEGRLDGTSFASSAAVDVNNSIASTAVRVGTGGAGEAGVKTYIDDFAINDDQGSDQQSWPGDGRVILLRPAAHSAIGTWVGPQTTGDDTTALNDNVDNTPPTGVAHSDTDANAGKYVFNITNSANQNFDLAVTDYTTAGIAAADTITLVQAMGRMSVNTTTGTNTGAVAGVSNPAITARTGLNLEMTAIAGTEPTGWKSWRTSPSYSPSVTKGTQPVVRVQKEVANTNAAMADLMGLVVEYVKTPVTSDRQIPYSINTYVTDDVRVVYGMGGTVTSERRVKYDLRGYVAEDVRTPYNIRTYIEDDTRVAYNVATSVISDRRIVYDILFESGPAAAARLPLTHAG